ncbi:MAG: minichromosome maintenance protein MCM [Candidatus Aenigmarchaeota archaeon]|nr:minichromosome maintenance protein MCM [Candidatus Aenigmarchaeota archaeon]
MDLEKLARFNHELADLVTERPDEACGWAEYAIKRIGVPTASGAEFSPHVRFYNLPADPYDVMVQNLGAEHLNKLARVQGVISLISDIKPRMVHALWECLHCESRVKVLSDKGNLVPPGQCNSCGRKGKGIFRLIEKSSEFTNMQNVKLQELVERVRGASPAAQIDLWLEDDLTNMVVPGEKVLVSGILRLRPMITKKGGRSSVYAKFLDVVHVQKLEQEFEEVEISKEEEAQIIELSKNPRLPELIAQSIASGIYGHNEMKQAIALQLFGGTPNKVLPDGQKIRSDIHVLLVGDPGTGKSALMLYVARLAPKCIYVAGASSSAVGLTAAAERDEFGEGWVLKAGALVLASGGMAAIDEFEKMKAEDRGAIHECLEQQYVSIAKAGMVTSFKAQTALLAAANPKFGRFDLTQPVAQQFALEPALLSRFDLIFPVKDVLDETRDRRLAEHIIKGHKSAAKSFKGTPDESIVPPISVDLLRKYIAYARRNTSPELTEEASDKIKMPRNPFSSWTTC